MRIAEIRETSNQVYICSKGHELRAEQVYVAPSGRKRCRLCNRERAMLYRKKNRDKIYKQQKAWAERNPEMVESSRKRYYAKNKGKIIQRTVDKRFGGMREVVINRDKGKCIKCGMSRIEHKKIYGCDITINHKDGTGRNEKETNNNIDNMETLCLSCHGRKDSLRYWNNVRKD